jgi:hypothetical protein
MVLETRVTALMVLKTRVTALMGAEYARDRADGASKECVNALTTCVNALSGQAFLEPCARVARIVIPNTFGTALVWYFGCHHGSSDLTQ